MPSMYMCIPIAVGTKLQVYSISVLYTKLYYISVCVADIALILDHSGSIRDTNPTPGQPGYPHDNWEDVSDCCCFGYYISVL